MPAVRPNRILTAAQPLSNVSRVLVVNGPRDIVNKETLLQIFQGACAFDIEYIRYLPTPGLPPPSSIFTPTPTPVSTFTSTSAPSIPAVAPIPAISPALSPAPAPALAPGRAPVAIPGCGIGLAEYPGILRGGLRHLFPPPEPQLPNRPLTHTRTHTHTHTQAHTHTHNSDQNQNQIYCENPDFQNLVRDPGAYNSTPCHQGEGGPAGSYGEDSSSGTIYVTESCHDNATMEWAFGSYRCQAERAYNALRRYRNVTVWHGRDPCDRVD